MICITGASGFIGSHLLRLLGATDVICCDPRDPSMTQPGNLLEQLNKTPPSIVYHLGAISSTTETNTHLISVNNIAFSCELLEFCINRSIPFVYASSASVYGLAGLGFKESIRSDPMNYYAISKACFDDIVLQKIADNPKSKIFGMRYFNVYGNGEGHKGDMASPIHKFIRQSELEEIKVFKGSENFLRDFVHVRDVVRITSAAHTFKPGIYNVGTGRARSFLEVAKAISNVTGAKVVEIPFPEHLVGKYQDYTCANNQKIDLFYFHERLTLEEGIAEVIHDWCHDA